MNGMIFYCKDCVHYVPEMGTFCSRHTERSINPHSDDICEDFACGDERLETLELCRDGLRRIEAIAGRLDDMLSVACAEDVPYLFKLAELMYEVVCDAIETTYTDVMNFEEEEAYLAEVLPEDDDE